MSEHLRKAIDGNKKEENETVVLNNINLDAEVEDKGNELNFVVAEEEQAVEQKDEDLELANWINEGLCNVNNRFKGKVYL